jgi:hypothetical protein
MTGRVRLLFGIAALAWSLLVFLPPRAAAQPRGPRIPRVPPKGTHAFRLILHGSKLQPLDRVEDLQEGAEKKLLIIFGDLGPLQRIDEVLGTGRPGTGLQRFLQDGGAVLIASDRGEEARLLGRALLVHLFNGFVFSRDPQASYRGQPKCPFAAPNPQSARHPIFRGVTRLATNTPSFLMNGNADLRVLAQFPNGEVLFANPNGAVQNNFQGDAPFAIGNDAPMGKTLVLAGHGVFMNGVMANRDNILFARNCIDWFTRAKDGGKLVRSQVLFFEEGDIRRKFDVPLVEIPALPVPPVQNINRLMRNLENENFFNRLLLHVLGPPGLPENERMAIARQRLLRWIILLLTLILVVVVLRRLWGVRYPVEPVALLLTRNPAGNPSDEPVMAQRQQGMLQDRNFWEAARELARQCFAAYVDHSTAHPPPRPDMVVRGGWWRRRALDKQVQRLWELAYETPARPISAAQFTRVAADADEVKAALVSGVLVLHQPERAQSLKRPRRSAAPRTV